LAAARGCVFCYWLLVTRYWLLVKNLEVATMLHHFQAAMPPFLILCQLLAYLLHYLPPACQNQSAPWLAGEAIINQSSPTNFIKAAPSFHTSVHLNPNAFSVPRQWVSLFICPACQALAIPLCYAGPYDVFTFGTQRTLLFSFPVVDVEQGGIEPPCKQFPVTSPEIFSIF
jgi:hypothetical protein